MEKAFAWIAPVGAKIIRRRHGSAQLLAPRMAQVAVRIPAGTPGQLPLELPGGPQIFIHEGARQALERRLELASSGPVHLSVTDNRRRMVTQVRQRGALRVRLHMMFLDAPERVKEALVRYVARADRDASQLVSDYIESNSFRIRAERRVTGPLRSQGQHHDLGDIVRRLNERYFAGAATDVLVTWGRKTKPRGHSRSSIKLGTYSATERLVRVHPALDQRWVPRYFVEYIVFHELLHHLMPPVKYGTVTALHTPEFAHRERFFRHYERALVWERGHLDRLLRSG